MKKVAAILATLVLVATSTLAAPADTAASAVPSPANNKAGVTKPASVKAATDKGGADKAAAGAGDWYYPPYGAAPGTQPGCGPYGCRNPTGTWGLERDPRQYRALCAQHSLSAEDDYRSRACFDTDRKLEEVLSAPNPHRLYGYIDGSDTSKSTAKNTHKYTNTCDKVSEC